MYKIFTREHMLFVLLLLIVQLSYSQKPGVQIYPVDTGWAANSVNTVPFRKNSLVTWKNFQYISFYNTNQRVVVGKRETGSPHWELTVTPFSGNARDAHNSISIIADGEGFIHLSWDHHNNPLRYARSTEPGGTDFKVRGMIGSHENTVTYPEFYRLADGNLLFLYRDGQSGKGNLIINRYDAKLQSWFRIHDNLISGEGQRNAYWQACVDSKGVIHLSWVWRESADVASNHDLCYARSRDNGKTWQRLNGKSYELPITASTAEYAIRIPQNSELINQTSMASDEKGRPYIATYWKNGAGIPVYQLVFAKGRKWLHREFNFRKAAFSLSGTGTKQIPISRPQVMVTGKKARAKVVIVFRDSERHSTASVIHIPSIKREAYDVIDLMDADLGEWEPMYDPVRWTAHKKISLFVQQVHQRDAEGLTDKEASLVYVLECDYPFPK